MRRVRILLLLVLGVWIIGALGLWIAQGRHDQLPLDLDAQYPAGQQFQPGEIFASTLIAIMDHELHDGFGWRPNDFFLWGPTLWADDNANRQLGILQAVRESMRVFKDHLTKVSSNEYDPDLLQADTLFRNDAEKLWFPSAEGQFSRGIRKLRDYVIGLRDGSQRSRPVTTRNVELVRLFQAWTDLLGDAHASLYKEREADGSSVWWHTDDYFYHAQGYAHVMYALLLALKREYHQLLSVKPVMQELFDEASAALHEAAVMNPLVILNGSPSGLFANHRRNLDTYITEARQKMYSIREELEK
ncbi:MAG TPA: DUF2333 family protein [Candidatus Binatia bacterium]|nr:DUF2333 family protein [Candidatus Binatia bacterium]